MRIVRDTEFKLITGGTVKFNHYADGYSIQLNSVSDTFIFNNITFTTMGGYFNGQPINPMESYSGFKISGDNSKEFYLTRSNQ